MINCVNCGTKLSLSDLTEHLLVDHDQDSGRDCEKCGGVGEYLASRVPNARGDEDWRMCQNCRGTGRV